MRSFLANYSENLLAALLLWPMASAFLTLPILAYLYHHDGRLRPASVAAVYFAVLYLLGIGCFTLWPLPEGTSGPGISYGVPPNFNPLGFVGDIARDGLTAVFQLLFNVVFFVPLGFIEGRLLRMRAVPSVAVGLAVSALVEIAQLTGLFGLYPYAYRCCDVDDLVANTLGCWIGWAAAAALNKAMPQRLASVDVVTKPGLLRRCVALWIDFSIVALASSFVLLAMTVEVRLATGLGLDLFGLGVGGSTQLVLTAAAAVVFVAVEVVVPWRCGGRTPGGAFVRMTCESHSRRPVLRVLFYVARTVALLVLVLAPWAAVPAFAIFYLAARKMPYDYIP